jgi:hypothetical protein
VTYNSVTDEARLTFVGLPAGSLPAGSYQLTLSAAGVQNSKGAVMRADYVLNFHVQPGDANGDQVTNDLDLYRVWQNLAKPLAQRDLGVDLTGDGQVTVDDLNVVKANYRKGATKTPPATTLLAMNGPNPGLSALPAANVSAELRPILDREALFGRMGLSQWQPLMPSLEPAAGSRVTSDRTFLEDETFGWDPADPIPTLTLPLSRRALVAPSLTS